jgi:hypothetical protein
MEWWQAALWGLAGGACVELWNLHCLTRQPVFSWRRPIPQGLSAYVTSVLTRLAIGTIVAAAAAAGNEITGAWVAFGLGVAGPLVVQRLAGDVPLAGGEELKPLPADSRQGRPIANKERQPVPGSGDGDSDGDTR